MTDTDETIIRMLTDRETAARNWQALADQRETLIQQQRAEIERLARQIAAIRRLLQEKQS